MFIITATLATIITTSSVTTADTITFCPFQFDLFLFHFVDFLFSPSKIPSAKSFVRIESIDKKVLRPYHYLFLSLFYSFVYSLDSRSEIDCILECVRPLEYYLNVF